LKFKKLTIIEFIKNIFEIYIFVFKEVHKASKLLLSVLLFSTIVVGCVPIFTQYLLKLVIVSLENNENFKNFLLLVGLYALALIIKNIMLNAKEYINTVASFRLAYSVQNKLIKKIKKVEYKNFYSTGFQNLYTTVSQNCQNEVFTLVFSTVLLLTIIIQIIGSCIVIVNFNMFVLALLVICTIPSIIININAKRKQFDKLDERSFYLRKMNYGYNVMTEKIFVNESRLFGLHDYFYNKRKYYFSEYIRLWKIIGKKEFFYKIFSVIFPCVGVLISFLWIIFQTTKNVYSISDFVFYSGIIIILQLAFESLATDISQSYKSISYINKLFEFLKMKNEILDGKETIKSADNYVLEFNNVSFKYPNCEKFVLKDINLKIKTGEQIALVGRNGCGKTTLIGLILRIFDPTEGTILLNGIDIKNYNFENYLKFFSAVFQDYQQYSVNLHDYISFGNLSDSKNISKIKEATIDATANNFIEKSNKAFKSNLSTKFDKEGLELSGGQWQKLAIARVFFSNANILIFDEPTSSLDAISESEIYKNIQNIGKNKISIFVSHRMYFSKMANRIIYIENGVILNDGKHEELMQNCCGYRELFDEQANKYIV